MLGLRSRRRCTADRGGSVDRSADDTAVNAPQQIVQCVTRFARRVCSGRHCAAGNPGRVVAEKVCAVLTNNTSPAHTAVAGSLHDSVCWRPTKGRQNLKETKTQPPGHCCASHGNLRGRTPGGRVPTLSCTPFPCSLFWASLPRVVPAARWHPAEWLAGATWALCTPSTPCNKVRLVLPSQTSIDAHANRGGVGCGGWVCAPPAPHLSPT